MKHLLKLLDLTGDEILEILALAAKLKQENKRGIAHRHLEGKSFGMIFEKSSTRTRVSFEVGAFELGMHPLFLSSNDLQLGRGESIADTARVLSRYVHGLMIRTFKQSDAEELAKYSSIPIINALTDDFHPCQTLADLLTIQEFKGDLKDLTIAFIGDGNNMCNSTIAGGLKCGANVHIANPGGKYAPLKSVLDFAKGYDDKFKVFTNPAEAAKNADVLIADVFTSMGQEAETAERLQVFANYQINKELLSRANSNAIVLHCLPAHKGEEITEDVFEAHSNVIFEEAENRLHVQKAVMLKLMGD